VGDILRCSPRRLFSPSVAQAGRKQQGGCRWSTPIMAQCPGESSLTIPILLPDLGSGEEHVALLVQPTTNYPHNLMAVENQR
jgi:hypothetical protein